MDAETPRGDGADVNREPAAPSGWVTTAVAAKSLGVSPRTVRWHIDRKNLEAKAEGEGVKRSWLVSIDSLQALRDTRQHAAQSPGGYRADGEGADIAADSPGNAIRELADRLVEEASRASEFRVRLELSERAESTLREELAEERRQREEAERQREDFRRELEALREAPESRETEAETRESTEESQPTTGGRTATVGDTGQARPLAKKLLPYIAGVLLVCVSGALDGIMQEDPIFGPWVRTLPLVVLGAWGFGAYAGFKDGTANGFSTWFQYVAGITAVLATAAVSFGSLVPSDLPPEVLLRTRNVGAMVIAFVGTWLMCHLGALLGKAASRRENFRNSLPQIAGTLLVPVVTALVTKALGG